MTNLSMQRVHKVTLCFYVRIKWVGKMLEWAAGPVAQIDPILECTRLNVGILSQQLRFHFAVSTKIIGHFCFLITGSCH